VDASGAFAAIHPDDAQAVLESIQESARALTPWQHEYRARFADGSVHWLYGNSLPERLDDGSVLWHGFITDITERKAADERLRQLSRSVEQAPLSIVITDLQGDILYVNPSFTRHTGYTLDEVLGHNPRILKSGQTPQQTYLSLWDTLCSGAVWEGELYNRRKNGEMFIEHAVIAPVLDAQGKTSHYVAVKEDITERKGAEQALQASLHEKVALLNEVHHRVKNNLQVISSLLRLEASRCTEPATKDVLKEMQGRILTMALLHETLYRVGRFASVDLGAYLKQLATQTFRAQSSQSTTVRLSLDVAEVQVVMDQATPCGLLVNELLSNCLKHAFPDGRTGEVQVRSQPDVQAGSWMVQVRDNGIGLPPDFELRGRQSLGLQLVSDLARQLDGSLQVASSGVRRSRWCSRWCKSRPSPSNTCRGRSVPQVFFRPD
jgi:PAS domain S-box-containing protein